MTVTPITIFKENYVTNVVSSLTIPRESKEKCTKVTTEWYTRDTKRNKYNRQTKRWKHDSNKINGPVGTSLARNRKKWASLKKAFVDIQFVKHKHSVADD